MKKKYLFAGIFALLICFTSIFSGTILSASANENQNYDGLQLKCKSAYCMDANSSTSVCNINATERLPIASMCKIMTLILSFDAIDSGKMDYETIIPVSEHAMSMGGSQVYLEAGGQYTADQLMKSVTVCSANDSCVALAEYIAGSDTIFVQKMNERAKELGCENTLFANCTGLPKSPQYSCAKDVALMLKELIKHKRYFSYSKIWTEEFDHGEGRTTLITNTNKLVRHYQGCDGGKTGFTNEAGFCLAATAKRGDMRIIAVAIGSTTSKERFASVSRMFDYTFANYTEKEGISATPLHEKMPVKQAKQSEITIIPERAVRYFCKNGEENVNLDYSLSFHDVTAPLKMGDKVGEMIVFKNGVEYEKVNLLAGENAEKATLFDYYQKIAANWVI